MAEAQTQSTSDNFITKSTAKSTLEELNFDGSKAANKKEIVDIVNDYTWTNILLNSSNNSISSIKENTSSIFGTETKKKTTENTTESTTTYRYTTGNSTIPFAICIERKQAVASNIMNLVGAMVALKDSFGIIKSDYRSDNSNNNASANTGGQNSSNQNGGGQNGGGQSGGGESGQNSGSERYTFTRSTRPIKWCDNG